MPEMIDEIEAAFRKAVLKTKTKVTRTSRQGATVIDFSTPVSDHLKIHITTTVIDQTLLNVYGGFSTTFNGFEDKVDTAINSIYGEDHVFYGRLERRGSIVYYRLIQFLPATYDVKDLAETAVDAAITDILRFVKTMVVLTISEETKETVH